jgi:predicted phosphodiesterase
MRLQIASDLHLHRDDGASGRYGPLRYVESDALLLAGDIDRVDRVSARFEHWPCQVLYVRGNHDSYFTPYELAIRDAAAQSKDGRFRLLEREVVNFSGVRILGCCLWTSFDLFGRVEDALLLARWAGPDYRLIYRSDKTLFSPEDARREHFCSVEWLRRSLAVPFHGKTVVVTHHAPHLRSLDRRFGRNRMDSAFASDLSSLMRTVNIWVHGHTHVSCDYKVGRCRVVCNPAGNPAHPNPHFLSSFIIDV